MNEIGDEARPISVSILDKEYVVACDEKERESLFATVKYLNMKMQQLRDSGKIIGTERIAVITALNIAHEYLEYRTQKERYTASIDTGIQRLKSKIANVLERSK
jgi:cell division protein ZapA